MRQIDSYSAIYLSHLHWFSPFKWDKLIVTSLSICLIWGTLFLQLLYLVERLKLWQIDSYFAIYLSLLHWFSPFKWDKLILKYRKKPRILKWLRSFLISYWFWVCFFCVSGAKLSICLPYTINLSQFAISLSLFHYQSVSLHIIYKII